MEAVREAPVDETLKRTDFRRELARVLVEAGIQTKDLFFLTLGEAGKEMPNGFPVGELRLALVGGVTDTEKWLGKFDGCSDMALALVLASGIDPERPMEALPFALAALRVEQLGGKVDWTSPHGPELTPEQIEVLRLARQILTLPGGEPIDTVRLP